MPGIPLAHSQCLECSKACSELPVEILLRHFVKLMATEDETEGGPLMRSCYGGTSRRAGGLDTEPGQNHIGLAGSCAAVKEVSAQFRPFEVFPPCNSLLWCEREHPPIAGMSTVSNTWSYFFPKTISSSVFGFLSGPTENTRPVRSSRLYGPLE